MILRISVVIFILLSSCATTPRPADTRSVPEQVRVETSFKTETPDTKSVGETMIERVYQPTLPGFEALQDFDIPNVDPHILCINCRKRELRYMKGTIWRCSSLVLADDYLCSIFKNSARTAQGVIYDLVINKSGDVLGIIGEQFKNIIKFDRIISGKTLPIDIPSGVRYKQELLYSGKSKFYIKLSYREYKDDMARPVFFQDLTYDLESSPEIAFQDLRIEILDATNSTIKFFVKKE